MISLITCSIRPDVCKKMLDSVSKTIGAAYETIVFDNREKKYGICSAYNEAAENANGDYLCFVHEDIEIQSNGWGESLIAFVSQTENCGVIGLAGGHYVPRNFIGWNVNNKTSPIKIYDPTLYGNDMTLTYRNPQNEIFTEVVCLDGVLLFVKKKVWQESKFDENTFKGFHFYDTDFSFAIAQKYRNYVFFGMDVYHYSGGKIARAYCENMYLFQKKWNRKLPYCLSGYNCSFSEEMEKAVMSYFLYRNNNFSRMESYKRIYSINGMLFFIKFIFHKDIKK